MYSFIEFYTGLWCDKHWTQSGYSVSIPLCFSWSKMLHLPCVNSDVPNTPFTTLSAINPDVWPSVGIQNIPLLLHLERSHVARRCAVSKARPEAAVHAQHPSLHLFTLFLTQAMNMCVYVHKLMGRSRSSSCTVEKERRSECNFTGVGTIGLWDMGWVWKSVELSKSVEEWGQWKTALNMASP